MNREEAMGSNMYQLLQRDYQASLGPFVCLFCLETVPHTLN